MKDIRDELDVLRAENARLAKRAEAWKVAAEFSEACEYDPESVLYWKLLDARIAAARKLEEGADDE